MALDTTLSLTQPVFIIVINISLFAVGLNTNGDMPNGPGPGSRIARVADIFTNLMITNVSVSLCVFGYFCIQPTAPEGQEGGSRCFSIANACRRLVLGGRDRAKRIDLHSMGSRGSPPKAQAQSKNDV